MLKPFEQHSPPGQDTTKSDTTATSHIGHAATLLDQVPNNDTWLEDNKGIFSCPTANSVIVEEKDEGVSNMPIESPNLDQSTETWKDCEVCPDLSFYQQKQVTDLLQQYPDVLTDVPGQCTIGEHKIALTSDEPFKRRNIPVPQALQGHMKDEIAKLVKNDIIEPSNSPYSNPVLLIAKPDKKSYRMVFDARAINNHTIPDCEPMPHMQTMFDDLAECKYMSHLDLTCGYFQINLHKDSRKYTAFTTGLDAHLYQFKKMPFGLRNSGQTFVRVMRQVLAGIPNIRIYVDDIMIYTKDWKTHLDILKQVLDRLRKYGLTAKPSKAKIGFPQIQFVGFTIGNGEKRPIDNKVEAIVKATKPKTKRQLKSFLGSCGWYRASIPNYSDKVHLLTEQTKKCHPNSITWNPKLTQDFEDLKSCLAKRPVLKLVDYSLPFIVQTDGSSVAISGVLLQPHNGVNHPVHYVSRKLLPREQNYPIAEIEALAVVYSLDKFKYYLDSRKFTLYVDSTSLLHINNVKKQSNQRLVRWGIQLTKFDFDIKRIKGEDNHLTDYLSRCVE